MQTESSIIECVLCLLLQLKRKQVLSDAVDGCRVIGGLTRCILGNDRRMKLCDQHFDNIEGSFRIAIQTCIMQWRIAHTIQLLNISSWNSQKLFNQTFHSMLTC